MTRKIHSSEMKARAAIDAIKEEVTIAELAKKYFVHPGQIQSWKSEMLSSAKVIFEPGGKVDISQDKHIVRTGTQNRSAFSRK